MGQPGLHEADWARAVARRPGSSDQAWLLLSTDSCRGRLAVHVGGSRGAAWFGVLPENPVSVQGIDRAVTSFELDTDSKLPRDVALKLAPDVFAQDDDRRRAATMELPSFRRDCSTDRKRAGPLPAQP